MAEAEKPAADLLRERLEAAQVAAAERDRRAERIVWTSVLANAGLGAVPFGVNVLTFVAANVTMVAALGHVYGYTTTREQAGALIRQILSAVGITWAIGAIGAKLFAEIVKVAGIATLGAATVAGVAFDAALSGALSYALGYTAMTYFKTGSRLGRKEMRDTFRASFTEGRAKIRRAS